MPDEITISVPIEGLFREQSDEDIVVKSASALVNLLAAHWSKIKELSHEEGAEDRVKVAVNISFSFGGRVPAANVEIAYVPLKTKDSANVFGEDNQEKLPLDEAHA
jgi:hypothetical protein